MPFMVPNNDCRMLLSIIGTRKRRNVFRRDGAFDTFRFRGEMSSGWLEHDPEKWAPVFPRDKRGTRLRGDHAQIKEIDRDDDSKKRHRGLVGAIAEGEHDDVVADIVGPAGDKADEPPPVVG